MHVSLHAVTDCIPRWSADLTCWFDTGNRLWRNLFSSIEIQINLIHLSSRCSPWLENQGNGCQDGIPLWRVKRGDIYGTTRKGQEKKVCKLVKSINGLKQAGRVWYELLADTLRRKLGFERINSDAGVYVLHRRGGNQTEIILILYINDLLLIGNDLSMINRIKKKLGEAYHMKDLGATQSYLGIWITRNRAHRCIWIDQEAYIDSAITQFHLINANDTKTPLPAGVHLI